MDKCCSVNEGSAERVGRGVLAGVFLLLAVGRPGPLRKVCYALAALMGVTAATGFCPAYKLLGVDTTKVCTFENAKARCKR